MRRLLSSLVFLMAASHGGAGFGAFADGYPHNGRLSIFPGETIVQVGDSITDAAHPDGNYGATMRATTDLAFTRRGLTPPTWINTGVSGDHTPNLAEETDTRITDYHPSAVQIFIGVNDSSFTVQQTVDAYNSILDDIAAAGIQRVLIITPWLHFHATLDARCDAIAAIAYERRLPLVHQRRIFLKQGQPAGLDTDGVHPSAAGKIWLSNNTLKFISPQY